MKSKKREILITLTTGSLIALLFATTFIPQTLFNLKSDKVESIMVIDSDTYDGVAIEDKNEIENLLQQFNEITFSKGKPVFSTDNRTYSIYLYKPNNKTYKKTIYIYDSGLIEYNGFYYKDKTNSVPEQLINKLFENN